MLESLLDNAFLRLIAFLLNCRNLLQSLDEAKFLQDNLDTLLRNMLQKTAMERAEALHNVFDTFSQFALQSSEPVNINNPNEAYDLSRLPAWLMWVGLDESNFVNDNPASVQLTRDSLRRVVIRVTYALARTIVRLEPTPRPALAHRVCPTTLTDCIRAVQQIRVGDFAWDCSVVL